MIVYRVTCGGRSIWATSKERANELAKTLWEFETDGVPFVDSLDLAGADDVVDQLNLLTGGVYDDPIPADQL